MSVGGMTIGHQNSFPASPWRWQCRAAKSSGEKEMTFGSGWDGLGGNIRAWPFWLHSCNRESRGSSCCPQNKPSSYWVWIKTYSNPSIKPPCLIHASSCWTQAICLPLETKAKMTLVEVGCKWNGKVPADLSELPHPPRLKTKWRKSETASSFSSPWSGSFLGACKWNLCLETLYKLTQGKKNNQPKQTYAQKMHQLSKAEQKLRCEFTQKRIKDTSFSQHSGF